MFSFYKLKTMYCLLQIYSFIQFKIIEHKIQMEMAERVRWLILTHFSMYQIFYLISTLFSFYLWVESKMNQILIYSTFFVSVCNNKWLSSLVQSRVQTKHGEAAFSCYAANKWNKLPVEIKLSPNVDVLKSRLKTFLFSCVYA